MREKFYQVLANFIYNQLKKAKSDKQFKLWYDFGKKLNADAVSYDIYLN